jgi:hypothetical protein
MTEIITILRCALCKKSFSYIPTPEDACRPGARNQICTPCCERHIAEAEREGALAGYYLKEEEGLA